MLINPSVYQLFILFGYVPGALAVFLGSFGKIEPEPLKRMRDYTFYKTRGMKWWHLTYLDDGSRYMISEGVAFVGWALIVAVLTVAYLLT